jgi:isopentenyldiphosphate isomerase
MIEKKYVEDILSDMINIEGIHSQKQVEEYREQFLEPLDVLNEDGSVAGTAPRGICHRIGLRHGTVSVIIVRRDGRMLLQHRGGGIDRKLKRLDVAVSGHLKAGEKEPKLSACREMSEELGINPSEERMKMISQYNRDAPLNIAKPYERNRERRYLFQYSLTDDEGQALDSLFQRRESTNEVTAVSWYTGEEVLTAIDTGRASDGLLTSFVHYLMMVRS